MQRLVNAHVGMYLDGLGGTCATAINHSSMEGKVNSVIE
jgi:hypothetical protein